MIRASLLAATVATLAGCPSTSSTLWLAPDQNETHVKLVESEPGTF